MVRNKIIAVLIIVLCCFSVVPLVAQKLPNVQESSLRAPKDVKVDGIPTEWNGYQAYNHATDIFYTIANDDDNLYITINSPESVVINKILGGGITFVIQRSGKSDAKDAITINYPVYDSKTRPYFRLKYKGMYIPPPELAEKYNDSVMTANNKKLQKSNKWIRVTGVTGLDTLLSIYNDDGIRAVAMFDNKKAYTCEMSISLKHLGFTAGSGAKFSYHVLLNAGSNKVNAPTITMGSGTDGNGNPISPTVIADMTARMNAVGAALYATTDFWGEYTLAAH